MGIFLSEYAWEVYLSYNTFMLTTHDAIQGPSTGFEPFIVATILPESLILGGNYLDLEGEST